MTRGQFMWTGEVENYVFMMLEHCHNLHLWS